MDWIALANGLIALLAQAPQLWREIETIVAEIKTNLSTNDLATLEAALAEARRTMPAERAKVDADLAAAALKGGAG